MKKRINADKTWPADTATQVPDSLLPLDRSYSVRDGERLNIPKLDAYLRRQGLLPHKSSLAVEQFPKGYSNLTYLLRADKQEWVLRRPPVGSHVKTAHDMGREFRILSQLCRTLDFVPKPILYCDDPSIIGAPFYIMERIIGVILRSTPPKGFHLTENRVRQLCDSFVDILVRLHQLDYSLVGLGDFGRPNGYMERQVKGWIRRYRGSQTDEIPDIDLITNWLAERMPSESGATLIHNDYKFDNLILDAGDPSRIIGVLDWEMSTIGEPLADLGIALGYWIEPTDDSQLHAGTCFLTRLPGSMTRAELAARYAEKAGRRPVDLQFYYCFALFRLAVITQQIYYRYAHRLTSDERFAELIDTTRALARRSVEAADRCQI